MISRSLIAAKIMQGEFGEGLTSRIDAVAAVDGFEVIESDDAGDANAVLVSDSHVGLFARNERKV